MFWMIQLLNPTIRLLYWLIASQAWPKPSLSFCSTIQWQPSKLLQDPGNHQPSASWLQNTVMQAMIHGKTVATLQKHLSMPKDLAVLDPWVFAMTLLEPWPPVSLKPYVWNLWHQLEYPENPRNIILYSGSFLLIIYPECPPSYGWGGAPSNQ